MLCTYGATEVPEKVMYMYNTELLISGNGFNGKGRSEIEENNKRFAIHILPKVNEQNLILSGEVK